MPVKCILLILCFFMLLPRSRGQELSFPDSVKKYDQSRLKINRTGAYILGGWGILNIAAGTIGYTTAKQDEAKYFSGMNGIWGVLATGISIGGFVKANVEIRHKRTYQQSYDQYLDDKKLYLVSGLVDLGLIAGGFGMSSYGSSAKGNGAVYSGFGKSIALQGVFFLLFNNLMLAEHQSYSGRWYRLMDEIRVTNNGIGFSHSF